eukprot:Nk52_evm1s2438 gene=Nk52_evmTU1s2438
MVEQDHATKQQQGINNNSGTVEVVGQDKGIQQQPLIRSSIISTQSHGNRSPFAAHQEGASGGGSNSSLDQGTAKWVPLIASREKISSDESVFRNVRGILNKLTPEKFDKLTDQLVNVGIYNVNILRGVIILLFEKALDEPHYSSLYAQTCVKLNQEAPSFEEPGAKVSTFRKLLLKKCQDEFQNRQEIFSQFEKMDDSMDDEEKQKRILAKRKMLGNIKFIGELGKLKILSSKVMHDCIRQLLGKVKNADPDDVECLCKLMTTVGPVLDTPEARLYMTQYFERMQDLATSKSLPSRHRFMVQDVLDLRKNDWVQRQWKQNKGPRSIAEIRKEADKEYRKSGYRGPSSGNMNHPQYGGSGGPNYGGYSNSNMQGQGHYHQGHSGNSIGGSGGGYMRGPGSQGILGRGGQQQYQHQGMGGFNGPAMNMNNKGQSINGVHQQYSGSGGHSQMYRGGYHNQQQQGRHGTGLLQSPPVQQAMRGGPQNGLQNLRGQQNQGTQRMSPGSFHSTEGRKQYGGSSQGYSNMMFSTGEGKMSSPGINSSSKVDDGLMQSALKCNNRDGKAEQADINLRPQFASSAKLPPSANIKQVNSAGTDILSTPNINPLVPSTAFRRLEIDDDEDELAAGATGSASTNPATPAKEITFEELTEKISTLVAEYMSSMDLENAVFLVKEMKARAEKFNVVDTMLSAAFDRLDRDRQGVVDILKECHAKKVVSAEEIVKSLNTQLESVEDLKLDIPHIETYILTYVLRFIRGGSFTLKDCVDQCNIFTGEQVLKVLALLKEQTSDIEVETAAKYIDLRSFFVVPTKLSDEEYYRKLESLKLDFLCPEIKCELAVDNLLKNEEEPLKVLEWLKANIDKKTLSSEKFIARLVSVILKYSSKKSIIFPDDGGRPTLNVSKEAKAEEARFIQKYTKLLSPLVGDSQALQVACIYGVQIFAHQAGFPANYMERMFTALYNLDICEEESFFLWKEDVRDDFPGKGTSLFQVNKWLNWLAEDDEESEEED